MQHSMLIRKFQPASNMSVFTLMCRRVNSVQVFWPSSHVRWYSGI